MALYSQQTEQIILGSLLSKPKTLLKLGIELSEVYFYYDKHKFILGAILSLQAKSIIPDIITVSDELDKNKRLEYVGGSSYLTEIVNISFEFPNTQHYITILKNKYKLRTFWEFFSNNATAIENGNITNPKKIIRQVSDKILNLSFNKIEKNIGINDICKEYTKIQEKYAEKKAEGIDLLGIPTKFSSLDRVTDGFQPEALWTIAAYTSVGKTTFMVNIIKRLLEQDKSVCLFSLETGKMDLFSKLLALEINCSPSEITKGLLDNDIYKKQTVAKQKYKDKKLNVYTEYSFIEDILLTMQNEVIKNKTDIFFIDYVQNLSSKTSNDQFRLINLAIKQIQTLTRKLKVTTVLLSQVSNESNKSKGSLEVGGKDAGAIRAASDIFIYLKREGTEEEILERYKSGQDVPIKVILNKNRMGKIGAFSVYMKQESGIIYEYF